jgi:uncharacterized repeat protein (TIGR02543 family)
MQEILMLFRRLAVISAITISASFGSVRSIESSQPGIAHASVGNGITAYISPPFVQGPPSSANATIEDFNAASFCENLGSTGVGTFSGSCTTVTSSNNDFIFGGANSTSDQPTVGGAASQFVAAWSSQVLTLSFAANSEARYLGFWWSAGSAGNQVRLYNKVNGSDVLAATFTTNNLNMLFNTSGQVEGSVLPPDPYPGNSSVTALDGSQYNKGYYFGRPKDHMSLTPNALPLGYTRANVNQNIYSHAYLNVYASGSISFSKVEFVGGGFELDNVAVSTQVRTPSAELVLLQSVLGKSVEFRANGGTGSMPAQTSDTSTGLSANTFTRTGYTFAGWSSSPTGTVEYTDLATYSFSADLALHAIWTLDPVTTTTTPSTSSPTVAVTTTTPTVAVSSAPPTTTPVQPVVSQVIATSLPTTGQGMSVALCAAWLLIVGVLLRRHRQLLSHHNK